MTDAEFWASTIPPTEEAPLLRMIFEMMKKTHQDPGPQIIKTNRGPILLTGPQVMEHLGYALEVADAWHARDKQRYQEALRHSLSLLVAPNN